MQSFVAIIFMIFLEVQIQPSLSRNDVNLYLCTKNRTMSVQILTGMNDDMSCQCQAGLTNDPNFREDYIHTPGIGSHKLHTAAQPWNEARRICNDENAHLAVINSKAEEQILMNELKKRAVHIRGAANRDEAYLGIHDYFKEGEWVTVFGESIYSTGYTEWSTSWYGPQPDNYKIQNCGALVVQGGMDDVKCSESYAFFCEIPSSCSE